jgi:protein-tyrosine phosphatase
VTRALEWDGCLNVRDLGGVALEGGGETRFGVFLRADNVAKLSAAGWRSLAGLSVTRIVDLRWPEEREQDPPRDLEIEVVHVSLLGRFDPAYSDDIDRFIEDDDPAGYWAEAYGRILARHRDNFGAALSALADCPGQTALFHCVGGRDRAGLVSALLLRLAGAPVDEIAADYALSEGYLAPGAQRFVESAPDEQTRRRRAFMQHAPAEAMARVLTDLEERHGGVHAYLRGAGLTAEQIERLRTRLREQE